MWSLYRGVAWLQSGQDRLQIFALHPFLGKISSYSLWWDPQGVEGKWGRFISQGRGHGPLKPLIKCVLYQKCATKELWPADLPYILLVMQVDLAAYIDLPGTQFICIYWALSCLQLDFCNTNLNSCAQTYFVSMWLNSPHEEKKKNARYFWHFLSIDNLIRGGWHNQLSISAPATL